MHLFIPYFDAARTETALHEACRITQPGDRVTVLAPVIVPAYLPLEVGAGDIWKRVCQAERRVFHAREMAGRILPCGVSLRCVRVQARDYRAAILAAAATYSADCILLAVPPGIRGVFAMHCGTIPAVIRSAPCNVRFVGSEMTPELRSRVAAPDAATALAALQVIAVNPALAGSGVARRAQKTEGQHAS